MKIRPIRFYRNALTGHRIAIQPAVHIGTPEFYADLKWRLMGLEMLGYKVHVEGTRIPELSDVVITDQEKDWLERLRITAAYQALAEALELVGQRSMGYEPTWENHDVTMLDMLRLVDDPEATVDRFEGFAKMVELFEELPQAKVFFRWIITSYWVMKTVSLFSRKDRTAHARREEVAVAAAVSSVQPVVMFWGAAHLPGMDRLLRQGGYRRDRAMEKVA